jgi:nitronate monooxygenase
VLLPQVKEISFEYGNFPIIVAGGIFNHHDIERFMAMGADGVQMGTRFLATKESSATSTYKQAVIDSTASEILVVPHSPCGYPFRILTKSPMYQKMLDGEIEPQCDQGYVLQKDAAGAYTKCPARTDCKNYFCICNGLLTSAGVQADSRGGLYTVGTNAERIDKIVSTKELMAELSG